MCIRDSLLTADQMKEANQVLIVVQRLAKENLPITLALSLHAPNDEKRRELMPIARKYPLEEVLERCV